MSITTDRNDPRLKKIKENGQQESYLVLSDEEREKGFVRPVRTAYVHVGIDLDTEQMRELMDEEKERFEDENYIGFIPNDDEDSAIVGRFITQEMLDSGCGKTTKINKKIAETYARKPDFYGATFCCNCGDHFPVEEFVWKGTAKKVGS